MNPDYAFLMYWAGLLFLILMLSSIALWGSMQPDFPGWYICNFCGPFYQIANFGFFYAGILHDVAFIRTAVVVANLFIAAYLLLGTSNWPNIWTSERACIRIDTLMWLMIGVAVNAIPLFRQVKFDDSKVKLENPEVTEAIWREWWRRSGIPRADFKEILQLADFVEATEGQQLPLKNFRGSNGWSPGSESETNSEESCDSAMEFEQDVFYYIITGSILLTPTPESGIKEVILDSGYFVDGPPLMTALGQSSVVQAMQPLPPTAVVVSEKTLLLRWTGRQVRQIINSNGFALECLRIVVASATLDSFYKNAVKEENLPTFQAVEAKRKELARAPLPKDAAMLQRSFFQQFCLSHMTFRDLWEPSPRQRVINAIRTGSRQMVLRQHVHETFESMTSMHRAASIPLDGRSNTTGDLSRLSSRLS